MPVDEDEVWPEQDPDLPPPEPAPADWAAPTPVETRIEGQEGIQVEGEEAALAAQRFHRGRRFWATTFAFFALFVIRFLFIQVSASPFGILWILLPLYLITLYFVLRKPKKFKARLPHQMENLAWQTKVMIGVATFVALYIPFSFISGVIIPFSSLVEYILFAVLLYVLLRLGGRGVGVAPSQRALSPPSHRLHQQVVAPIDDAHYQRTLWLNFNFVEKGKGGRNLARRLDSILESNGVEEARRQEVLAELHQYQDRGSFFARSGSDRQRRERDRRIQVLETIFSRLNNELERTA